MPSSLRSLLFSLILLAPGLLPGAGHPLANTKAGQWAKYLITYDVPSEPYMSSKDAPRWRIVTDYDPDTGFIRADDKILFGNQRQSGGPQGFSTKEPFEPLGGLSANATISVVATESAKVVVAGKPIACTKIVRKIDSPLGEVAPSWKGTSTIWISADVPLGLVRMENEFDRQLSADDKPQHVFETWVLVEYGTEWKDD
jgi:hypothetical protein